MCLKWGEGWAADAFVNLYLRPNIPEQTPDGALHFLRNCLQRPERRRSHCLSPPEPILAQELWFWRRVLHWSWGSKLGLSVGRGLLVQIHCGNNPHWTPSQLRNAGSHVGSSQEGLSGLHPWGHRDQNEQREWACHQTHEDRSQSSDVPMTQCPAKLFQIMAFPLPRDSSNEAYPRPALGGSELATERSLLEPGCGLLASGLGQGVSPPQGLVSPSFMKEKVAQLLGWGQGFTRTAGAKHCDRAVSDTQYRHILGKTVTQKGTLWGQMGRFFFILRWRRIFDMEKALEEADWKGEGSTDRGLERTPGSPIQFPFPWAISETHDSVFQNCVLRRDQNHSAWASQLG